MEHEHDSQSNHSQSDEVDQSSDEVDQSSDEVDQSRDEVDQSSDEQTVTHQRTWMKPPSRIWKETTDPVFASDNGFRQSDSTMFKDIFPFGDLSKPQAVKTVIDQWVGRYKYNSGCLLEVLQFFMDISGCNSKLPHHTLNSVDFKEVIKEMSVYLEGEIYPIIYKNSCHTGLSVFVSTLVTKCKTLIVNDSILMGVIIKFLTAMSMSTARAFRHTGTIAESTITLNRITQIHQIARHQRLARVRVNEEDATQSELEHDISELRRMLSATFKNIYTHRYRDTYQKIEAACLDELEIWMTKFYSIFDRCNVVRFLGSALVNKTVTLRRKGLAILLSLFQNLDSEKVDKLITPLKEIIGFMTVGKTSDAVDAIKVLSCILKCHSHQIAPTDVDLILKGLFSTNLDAGKEAGKFLHIYLEMRTKTTTPNIQNRSHAILQMIVDICLAKNISRGSHGMKIFVESTIDSIPALTDWNAMCELLRAPCEDNFALCLMDLLVNCAAQGTTGIPPKWRVPKSRLPTKITDHASGLESFSDVMCQQLPELVAVYDMVPELSIKILSVVQYLDLKTYIVNRRIKRLDDLLQSMTILTEFESDTEVITSCAKTFKLLGNPTSAVYMACREKCDQIANQLINEFREDAIEYLDKGINEEKMNKSMLKLEIFLRYNNLVTNDVWPSLFSLCDQLSSATDIKPLKLAFDCCKSYIMWDFCAKESRECQHDERLRDFLIMCNDFMNSHRELLEQEAYRACCGLLLSGHNSLGKKFSSSAGVAVTVNYMVNFIENRVLVPDVRSAPDSNGSVVREIEHRSFLVWFCNLIVRGIINIKIAPRLFIHLQENMEYEKIIITTLKNTMRFDLHNCAIAVVRTLSLSFEKAYDEGRPNIEKCAAWGATKILAVQLEKICGTEFYKHDTAIVAMHQEGIRFCTTSYISEDRPYGEPPKLLFLNILCGFAQKLTPPMKKDILQMLELRLPNADVKKAGSCNWKPYQKYRSLLLAEMSGDKPSLPAKSSRRSLTPSATRRSLAIGDGISTICEEDYSIVARRSKRLSISSTEPGTSQRICSTPTSNKHQRSLISQGGASKHKQPIVSGDSGKRRRVVDDD